MEGWIWRLPFDVDRVSPSHFAQYQNINSFFLLFFSFQKQSASQLASFCDTTPADRQIVVLPEQGNRVRVPASCTQNLHSRIHANIVDYIVCCWSLKFPYSVMCAACNRSGSHGNQGWSCDRRVSKGQSPWNGETYNTFSERDINRYLCWFLVKKSVFVLFYCLVAWLYLFCPRELLHIDFTITYSCKIIQYHLPFIIHPNCICKDYNPFKEMT